MRSLALVALVALLSALPTAPATIHGKSGAQTSHAQHPSIYKALYRTALLNGYGGVHT
jgi:hypothetical protein